MENQVGDHALVLGASMAGLLAARVLSDSYARVTVVERDEILGATQPRRGVSQGGHAHALLARGQQIVEELFPGITDEFVELGMPSGDVGGDIRWYFNGQRAAPPQTGLLCISTYRPVLEGQVRTRVNALSNVTFRQETEILGLTTTADGARVTGARVQAVGADGAQEERIEADLTVMTTGRGARTPALLEEIGYSRPSEEKVKIGLSYTTRHYALPADTIGTDLAVIPVATPAFPRGAVFSRSCGRFQLSLTGILGDAAPTDPAGFEEFARSLPIPDIYEWIRAGEPLDDPVIIRYPASVRRRFEKLPRFPEGMIVMGDGVCSFNPVYAQGMTVSALEALTLRSHLQRGHAPRAGAFFDDIAKVIDAPWDVVATGDLSFDGVEGRRTAKVRFINGYMSRLMSAAPHDPKVTNAFLRSAGFIDAPTALMRPGTVYRVLKNSRHADRAHAAAPVSAPSPGSNLTT